MAVSNIKNWPNFGGGNSKVGAQGPLIRSVLNLIYIYDISNMYEIEN
jgi:hypothetical protein